jgi:hypothetical protein
LVTCESNPEFNAFVESKKRIPECKNLSLKDGLMLPIRRALKYPSMLKVIFWQREGNDKSKDLLRNTDKNHPDYENLDLAVAKAQTISSQTNGSLRESDTLQKAESIQLSGYEVVVR